MRRRPDQLRSALQAFAQSYAVVPRIEFDPIEFPRRYSDPADIEVVGLIAA